MTWIRSPSWDLCWIWSGLPIGAALIKMPESWRLPIFLAGIVLMTAHHLSPIVLTWTHPDLRRRALSDPFKFIGAPLVVLAIVSMMGVATSLGWTTFRLDLHHQMLRVTDWRNPFPVVLSVYLIWNTWHFGMQWYGVACLYSRDRPMSPDGRLLCACVCLTVMACGMLVMPFLLHSTNIALLAFGIFSMNHWLTDIGLSSRVSGRWWFIPVLLLLSCGALALYSGVNLRTGGFVLNTSLGHALFAVYSVAIATGFIHFLYSRWVWQLSDPRIRGIIAGSLFISPFLARDEQKVAIA